MTLTRAHIPSGKYLARGNPRGDAIHYGQCQGPARHLNITERICPSPVGTLALSTPDSEGISFVLIVFLTHDLSQQRPLFHSIVSMWVSVHIELEASSEVVEVDLSMAQILLYCCLQGRLIAYSIGLDLIDRLAKIAVVVSVQSCSPQVCQTSRK